MTRIRWAVKVGVVSFWTTWTRWVWLTSLTRTKWVWQEGVVSSGWSYTPEMRGISNLSLNLCRDFVSLIFAI